MHFLFKNIQNWNCFVASFALWWPIVFDIVQIFRFRSLIYKIRENPEFFASLWKSWSGSSFFRIRENCWALKSRSWAGDLKIRENPLWRRILENEGEFWARFKIRVKDEGSRFKIRENELRKILENEAGSKDLFGSEFRISSDICSSSPSSSLKDLRILENPESDLRILS